MGPMLEANGFDPEDIIPNPNAGLDPNHPAMNDMGGVATEGSATVQPRVALQGGQFGAKSDNGTTG